MEVVVLNNQSVLDIAVQEHGTVEAAFDIAIENDISITDYIVPSYKLAIEKSENADEPIQNYYKKNALLPATGNAKIEGEDEVLEGIDYMKIGTDFKVN